jgi:hypothetical protein
MIAVFLGVFILAWFSYRQKTRLSDIKSLLPIDCIPFCLGDSAVLPRAQHRSLETLKGYTDPTQGSMAGGIKSMAEEVWNGGRKF